METSVSVIVVAYNGSRYLEDCLNSLQPETGGRGEIIVVDNASSDGSADLVEAHFPDVRLLRNGSNRGFAAACNQGAALALGDVLVFLNQDTRVQAGWLAALVDALDLGDATALTTSKVLLMSQPERIHLCGQDVHFTGLAFGRGFLSKAQGMTQCQEVGAVSGASFAARRDVWLALGGFDEMLYMYYEDTDLSWRAQLAGYNCLCTPKSVVYHDYPLRCSSSAFYYSVRNRYLLLLKHWKWATLCLLLPGILLAEVVDWVYTLSQGRQALLARLRAYRWLLANLPAVPDARRRVRALRREPDWALLERCTYRLSPRLVTGRWPGKAAIWLLNGLLLANYWSALQLARWFDL